MDDIITPERVIEDAQKIKHKSPCECKESQSRSIIKTVSWRAVATIITFFLVWIFTGNLTIAAEIGALEVVLKLLFYYGHERIWGVIEWGRRAPKQKA
ncbi:MAG: DUF2061 domain-containing protein [bacterium]|nr:DUF2061 domain-containing protein [bacterium]